MILNVLLSLAVELILVSACLCISDKWTRRMVRPWLPVLAACFLRSPPAWTLCLCKTSFTKPSGRWDVRQRGAFHSGPFTSVKTKHQSASPLPRFCHPAIRSCPLRPQPSWWLWSPRGPRASAEHPHSPSSKASRSFDSTLPSYGAERRSQTWGLLLDINLLITCLNDNLGAHNFLTIKTMILNYIYVISKNKKLLCLLFLHRILIALA